MKSSRHKLTLDQIEGTTWGPPTYDSHLVRTCHRLRTVPLGEFTVEDLRIMIGQKISLPALLPFALDVIEANPLASGDMYPGDLLTRVIAADDGWRDNYAFRARLRGVLELSLRKLAAHEASRESFELDTLSLELVQELRASVQSCLSQVKR